MPLGDNFVELESLEEVVASKLIVNHDVNVVAVSQHVLLSDVKACLVELGSILSLGSRCHVVVCTLNFYIAVNSFYSVDF